MRSRLRAILKMQPQDRPQIEFLADLISFNSAPVKVFICIVGIVVFVILLNWLQKPLRAGWSTIAERASQFVMGRFVKCLVIWGAAVLLVYLVLPADTWSKLYAHTTFFWLVQAAAVLTALFIGTRRRRFTRASFRVPPISVMPRMGVGDFILYSLKYGILLAIILPIGGCLTILIIEYARESKQRVEPLHRALSRTDPRVNYVDLVGTNWSRSINIPWGSYMDFVLYTRRARLQTEINGEEIFTQEPPDTPYWRPIELPNGVQSIRFRIAPKEYTNTFARPLWQPTNATVGYWIMPHPWDKVIVIGTNWSDRVYVPWGKNLAWRLQKPGIGLLVRVNEEMNLPEEPPVDSPNWRPVRLPGNAHSVRFRLVPQPIGTNGDGSTVMSATRAPLGYRTVETGRR